VTAERRSGRLDRDPAAFEKPNADEIAHGTLDSIALVDLSRQLGDSQRLRVRCKRKRKYSALSPAI